MNEYKWLKREAPKWVEKGLIQPEQLNGLLSLYQKKKSGNILPIFASILIGLGVLTFVASNWGDMSDVFRMVVICAALIGFYVAGYHQLNRGAESTGIALIGIGVVTFGAGIFLTSQIFHIVSYSATAFILWLLVSLSFYLMFPNRYFYLLSLVIGTVGMIYTSISFQTFDPILAILVIGGLGYVTFRENRSLYYYLFAVTYSICGISLLIGYELSYLWMTVIFLVLYAVSNFINNRKVKQIWEHMSIVGAIIISFISVFILDDFIKYEDEALPSIAYFVSLIVLLLIVLVWKIKKSERNQLADLVLFLPLFMFGMIGDVLYLVIAFAYSLFILISGYQSEESGKINWGTGLFLLSTLVAYIQLAWDFLPKSIFFFAGGILLFILSWYLERRRRKWLHDARGGKS
ncbi:DUF2157 domain-containing protein [Alkalihalobacillus sp. AL-G]|uniref:DUF2157 domain-containing protein n=1 Tax=Alkalihalobacillus sp. AL-G TaxID=2926399 RepID=UPI002729F311|nr:DUF2157 domain-containing protein [Alkalihalobacillus sp. AL-G]WLD94182.1 DUF2157 domain-containing protein [Alkalihalobacillus sp. AL-G]